MRARRKWLRAHAIDHLRRYSYQDKFELDGEVKVSQRLLDMFTTGQIGLSKQHSSHLCDIKALLYTLLSRDSPPLTKNCSTFFS